jgi:hypothetical protein
MRAGGKVLVATSATAALSNHHAFVWIGEIMDQLAGVIVIDNGADRDFENNVFSIATGAIGTFTVPPAIAFVFRIEAEVNQRIVALAGFHDDVTTAAAVTAGWAASGNKFFAAEGHAAVAAVACFNADNSFVYKHELKL